MENNTSITTTGLTYSYIQPTTAPIEKLEKEVGLLTALISSYSGISSEVKNLVNKAILNKLIEYFGELTAVPPEEREAISAFNQFRNREGI